MKKTPIPEKIKQWVEEDAGLRTFHPTQEELVKAINSLIDVLTEQHERTNKLEGLVNHLLKNGTIHSKCIGELTRIVEQKPYTAMRSTGSHCTCMNCTAHDEVEPQEDVKAKELEKMLFYNKGWDGTYAEAHDLASSILLIVRGE